MNLRKLNEELKKLLEMSYDRKDAIRRLDNVSFPFAQHICKVVLWGNQNEQWLNHWAEEIFNYLDRIKNVKLRNNKSLDKKFYLKYFFNPYLKTSLELESMLSSVYRTCTQKDDYPISIRDINHEDVFKKYIKLRDYLLKSLYDDSSYIEIKDRIINFSKNI